MEKPGAHFLDRNIHPTGTLGGKRRVTMMLENAMPATLNIDLDQTTAKTSAMHALERLRGELG